MRGVRGRHLSMGILREREWEGVWGVGSREKDGGEGRERGSDRCQGA